LLHGQTRYNIKSRFFDELPEASLKWLTPKNQNFGGSSFGYGMGYPSSRQGGSSSGGYAQNYGRSETFASPPVPMQKADPGHSLRLGMQVFHAKFGEGTVLTLEGSGPDARAQINFPRHGHKWLALSVAKLTPVN
ncbi:MAG: uvrD, partial [Ramlibacter sp.]|nr:uvrD [Ramlibacter sp.]